MNLMFKNYNIFKIIFISLIFLSVNIYSADGNVVVPPGNVFDVTSDFSSSVKSPKLVKKESRSVQSSIGYYPRQITEKSCSCSQGVWNATSGKCVFSSNVYRQRTCNSQSWTVCTLESFGGIYGYKMQNQVPNSINNTLNPNYIINKNPNADYEVDFAKIYWFADANCNIYMDQWGANNPGDDWGGTSGWFSPQSSIIFNGISFRNSSTITTNFYECGSMETIINQENATCPLGEFSCANNSDNNPTCKASVCNSDSDGQAGVNYGGSGCYSKNCDAHQAYYEYCGSVKCPQGFGVYIKNGACFQDVCPSNSTEINGQCYVY